jgi:hypothetical protein
MFGFVLLAVAVAETLLEVWVPIAGRVALVAASIETEVLRSGAVVVFSYWLSVG